MSRNNAIRFSALVIQIAILILMLQAMIPPTQGGILILVVGFAVFFITRNSSGKKSG